MEEDTGIVPEEEIFEEKHPLRKPKGIIIAAGAFITAFAVLIGSVFVVPPWWGLGFSAVVELGILAVAVLFALFTRLPLREVFPVRRLKPGERMITGSLFTYLAAWLFSAALTYTMSVFFPRITEVADGINDTILSGSFFVSAIVICLLPAICEEALCRGTMLAALRPVRREWVRILVVGVLFGVLHGDPLRIPQTAALGMAFAYIVLRSGNILLAVLWHFVNNFFSVAMAFLFASLDDVVYEETANLGLGSDTKVMYLGTALMFAGFAVMSLYGGVRRLRGLELSDVDRVKRRRVQTAGVALIAAGLALIIGSCSMSGFGL